MAIKKISTEFQLLDKFLDTSGDAGSANQVLVSTTTGVNWVDGSGSGIIGGPYLPLAGGTITGNLGVGYAAQSNIRTFIYENSKQAYWVLTWYDKQREYATWNSKKKKIRNFFHQKLKLLKFVVIFSLIFIKKSEYACYSHKVSKTM